MKKLSEGQKKILDRCISEGAEMLEDIPIKVYQELEELNPFPLLAPCANEYLISHTLLKEGVA